MTKKRQPREPDVKATAELLFGLKMKLDCPACFAKGCPECKGSGTIYLLPKDCQ